MSKILIDRALLEHALKCLETPIHEQPLGMRTQTASAFRAALAQQAEPAQEPVAGAVLNADGRPVLVRNGMEDWYCKERNARRLYAAPPQRPPLTDKDMLDIIDDAMEGGSLLDVVRAVERKVRGEA